MALTEMQQLQNMINDSHYCLVIFNSAQDIDGIASALTISKYLQDLNKQVDIVCPNFTKSKNLKFLDGIDRIKGDISNSQKFTIKVDVADAELDTLSYDIKNSILSIHLNPHTGVISKKNLRTAQSTFKYDLIIAINTPDLESLGSTFTNNTDLFYRLPIINIDHDAANEHYGQLNLIEIEATSSCEVIYNILKNISKTTIKDTVATYILTGIISKTKSFKAGNITPHTLNIASQLMHQGADRDTIIKHLYYHRSISSLKIWGKALSNLQNDPNTNLVWTTITRNDLTRSGANREDLSEVIDEMLINSPEAEIIVLFYEQRDADSINCLVITTNTNALKLVTQYSPQGNSRRANIVIQGKTLKQAEEEIIQNIKNRLK